MRLAARQAGMEKKRSRSSGASGPLKAGFWAWQEETNGVFQTLFYRRGVGES
jgi:hypothetical protein